MSAQQQILDSLFFLGLALPLIAAATIWLSPDALRWIIMRLRMRVAFLEAGRDAAEIERKRFEEAAEV